VTGQRPPRRGGDPWRGGRPAGGGGDDALARLEVEELPVHLVERGRATRVSAPAAFGAALLVVLLAAGFGLLGGRDEPTVSAAPASDIALATAPRTTSVDPAHAAAPLVTPALTCGTLPDRPPNVFLVVDGSPFAGDISITRPTPRPSFGESPAVPASPVTVPADATTNIWIEDDACAIGWHIALTDFSNGTMEPLALQPNPGLDPGLASQNWFQIDLASFRQRQGGVEVRAALDFPAMSVVARWPLHFLPFERPKPRLVLVDQGMLLGTVEGCETVLTLQNGASEDAEPCNQDLASQLPTATKLRPGAPLAIAFNGWVLEKLEVTCGAASQTGFLTAPRAGCDRVVGTGADFVAPQPGDWTLAMGACALDASGRRNEICGTWYARVDTR
jgi:hypothetical protein